MPISIATLETSNGYSWGPGANYLEDADTNYGLQTATFGGKFYGIGTAKDTSLFFTELGSGRTWSKPTKLPSKYKAAGRVAVTATLALEYDRFYVTYRGTNDGVYLIYTTDFKTWTDLGRVGSKYAKSTVAPGLSWIWVTLDNNTDAERLLLTGVGDDKYIYYTLTDLDGKRDISWTKIPGTGTRSALSIGGNPETATLYHTAYNNEAFFYQDYDQDKKEWSALKKVAAPSITSGVSAATTRGGTIVAYRGSKEGTADTIVCRTKAGDHWFDERELGAGDFYQLGAGVTPSGAISISIPFDPEAEDLRSRQYKAPVTMSDKGFVVSEKELMGKEWNCKWQQQQDEEKEPQGLIKKFFCCG